MYEDDRHTTEDGNKVMKTAMCVFQLGTDPLSLLRMLPADLQVTAYNITAQVTIYNLCSYRCMSATLFCYFKLPVVYFSEHAYL